MKSKQTKDEPVSCRVGCGACCVAPSISSPIPGMPAGKPAGQRCVQLTADNRCALFGQPERPAVCIAFTPSREWCAGSSAEAMSVLSRWEILTG